MNNDAGISKDMLPIVRHGNIYTGRPFATVPYLKNVSTANKMPATYYDIDPVYINIHTSTFSQFICTVCNKKCTEDLVAMVSAGFKMFGTEKNVEVKTFVCNKLFTLLDYKQVG